MTSLGELSSKDAAAAASAANPAFMKIAALVAKKNISGASLVSEDISFVLEHLKGDDSIETMMLFVVWLEEQKKVKALTSTVGDTPIHMCGASDANWRCTFRRIRTGAQY